MIATWREKELRDYARLAVAQATERLRAERDALREDAERYRWLRISPLTLHLPIGCTGTGLDATIDGARKA